LYNVQLKIYDKIFCSYVNQQETNFSSQVCAGDMLGEKDTCQGMENSLKEIK
jgi:hypothetical protein